VKLFSQNSNLYDHDTSTSPPDVQTTCLGNTALIRVASRGNNIVSLSKYEYIIGRHIADSIFTHADGLDEMALLSLQLNLFSCLQLPIITSECEADH